MRRVIAAIRPVEPEDAREWVRMRTALWPESPADHAPEVQEYLLARPAGTQVFVAVREGTGLGGFAEVGERPFAEGCTTRPVGYLEGWWVDPDLRHAGVGRQLVEAAEAWARQRGFTEMASDAERLNRSSCLAHEALGYAPAAEIVCFCKRLGRIAASEYSTHNIITSYPGAPGCAKALAQFGCRHRSLPAGLYLFQPLARTSARKRACRNRGSRTDYLQSGGLTMIRILVVLACLLAPPAAWASQAEYTVIVQDESASVLTVECEFELESDVIGLQITGSPQLPNGQADLLENLRVRHAGKDVAVESLGTGDWRLAGLERGEQVQVSYEIRLEHDQYAWGPGIDEVAYRTDDGLFFTGFSLFVFPGYELPDGARIRFRLPPGWTASTPWPRDGDAFVASDANQLLRNCLFMGTHRTQEVELDDFRFTMVIGSDLWDKRQLFVDAMQPVLPAVRGVFGGMPAESDYLVVFNLGDRADGGAFAASYSMLLTGKVNESSGVIWGHGVAHEVIHFWNGHTVVPASQDEEWFKEGFTDYLTILVRSRTGLDSPERVFRKLENCMRRYALSKLLLGSESSLREAGHDKHRQRMLVYGGGTLVGLALDVRIREATDNRKGMDDFLAAMFAEFGEHDLRYDLDDVIRVASAVSGQDQADFFQRYVEGREFLDVTPYLASIGLQLDTFVDEFYLSVDAGATARQNTLRVAMFGH